MKLIGGWLFADTSKNRSRQWCDMQNYSNSPKSVVFVLVPVLLPGSLRQLSHDFFHLPDDGHQIFRVIICHHCHRITTFGKDGEFG